jgi:predicted nucleotidyltransferase
MARLVASSNALRTLLLLSQREEGMRTSEVAAALGSSYTGAEKALEILASDGLASVSGRCHVISDSARAREAVRFALAFLPPSEAMGALAKGNEGVEFAGVDGQGVLLVLRRFVELGLERRLRETLNVLADVVPGLNVELTTKETVRASLLTDLEPRTRARAMTILAGTVDRTFPDRTKHGDFDARPLGRLSPSIQGPSARRLRDFARRYGLRRILAFGSATREDFRPDSDLDLVVEPKPSRQLGLSERTGLIAAAERLFDRDVDVLVAPVRRASLAERIARDGVVLYDAAR